MSEKGWTIWDFLHHLTQKFGIFLFLLSFVLIVFLGGWAVTHIIAKPGTEISVWGGLIRYIKNDTPENHTSITATSTPTPALSPKNSDRGDKLGNYSADKMAKKLNEVIAVITSTCNAKNWTFNTLLQEAADVFFEHGYPICRMTKVHNYLVALSDETIINLVRYICATKWLPKELLIKEINELKEELNGTPLIGTQLEDNNGNVYPIERDQYGRIIFPIQNNLRYLDGEEDATYIQKFFYRQGEEFKRKFFLACDSFIEFSKNPNVIRAMSTTSKTFIPQIMTSIHYQGSLLAVTERITYADYQTFISATGWNLGDQPQSIGGRVSFVSLFSAIAYAEWLSSVTGEKYRIPVFNELNLLKQMIAEPIIVSNGVISESIMQRLDQDITSEIYSGRDKYGAPSYNFFRLIKE